MPSRARRLLSWTFIIAFFLIAPAIILSTAGYRYNFATRRLERTGVMVVESRPAGATITLNGERVSAETPARLPNLSPGAYDLRVEKAGYRPWEKSVTVESRSTAFLNQISLFRQAAPMLFSPAGPAVHPSFSPDARYAAAMTSAPSGSELAIIDLLTGVDSLPYRSSASAEGFDLSWSKDGRWLLIAHPGPNPAFLLWDARTPQAVHDLKDATGFTFGSVFWAQDEVKLYGVADGTLYGIDPSLPAATDEGPAVGQAVVADGVVYGIEAGKTAKLVRRKLKDAAFEAIAGLPSAGFRPLAGRDGRIAYVSISGDDLFVIDPSGERPKAFETRGKDGAWSADGSKLLYWNDLEVRIYDDRSGGDELITRLSGPIAQAAWHEPEWNALYAVNGTLYATETSSRYGRLTVPLTVFASIDRFTVSPNGDFAYVFGAKDGQSGLWRLRLR